METALAILMALGIYLVGPAVLGFAIAGIFILVDRRARRAQQAKSLEEAVEELEHVVAEAKLEEHAKTTTH